MTHSIAITDFEVISFEEAQALVPRLRQGVYSQPSVKRYYAITPTDDLVTWVYPWGRTWQRDDIAIGFPIILSFWSPKLDEWVMIHDEKFLGETLFKTLLQ